MSYFKYSASRQVLDYFLVRTSCSSIHRKPYIDRSNTLPLPIQRYEAFMVSMECSAVDELYCGELILTCAHPAIPARIKLPATLFSTQPPFRRKQRQPPTKKFPAYCQARCRSMFISTNLDNTSTVIVQRLNNIT